MKKPATLLVAILSVLALGCAKPVNKMWEAAGGSRADATVEVGYVYNPAAEIPQHNEQQGREEAIKRCQAWGYTDAEPFGLVKNTCQQFQPQPFGGMVCVSMFVSRQYQCLGRGDADRESENPGVKKIKP